MRVLLTRPQAAARRTAESLVALGHEPLVAPVLRIEPSGAPPPPGAFDAILLTSANAVAALCDLGARAPVFAVGERTAALARAAGFESRAAGGDAGALAALVREALPAGAALLHPVGADRKTEPEASLAASGYRVTTWIAYEAVAAERLPAALGAALEAGTLEAALHFSRRSAAVLVRLAAEAGLLAPLAGVRHACLSADAAAPLAEAGAGRIAVAAAPDEASLLAALAVPGDEAGPARLPSAAGAKDGTKSRL